MDDAYANDARVFKALCDENRLHILDLLKDGEMCACAILESMAISQSTLSHHLKILCESGIVSGRDEGKWTHYSLSRAGCELAASRLGAYTAGTAKAAKRKEKCV